MKKKLKLAEYIALCGDSCRVWQERQARPSSIAMPGEIVDDHDDDDAGNLVAFAACMLARV